MDLMIDIETLGVNPGCSILSIGAVLFDPHSLEPPQHTFYDEICRQSCRALGLVEEPNTLDWWTTQNMPIGNTPIRIALDSFFLWTSNCPNRTNQPIHAIWANSPVFDFAILRTACALLNRPWPFSYHMERDVRTIKHLLFPKLKLANTHNALNDSMNQARLIQIAHWKIANETRPQQPNH